MIGIILVNQIQSDQNDAYTRVNSLEYLGQIVSQLRKDSLEYQKYPEKVKNILEKINPPVDRSVSPTDNESEPTEATTTATETITKLETLLDTTYLKEDDLFNLQKTLINYLNSLVGTDSSLQFSKCFLIGQWIKEQNQMSNDQVKEHDQERLEAHAIAEENRKRIYNLIENSNSKNGSEKNQTTGLLIDSSEAFILAKYLSSLKRTLDKNFDYYLVNILSLSGLLIIIKIL